MTSAVKHAENAAKARRELQAVKIQASELINGLMALIKGMYLFGDLDKMQFEGKKIVDVVAELMAADSAEEMLSALRPNPKVSGDGPQVAASA